MAQLYQCPSEYLIEIPIKAKLVSLVEFLPHLADLTDSKSIGKFQNYIFLFSHININFCIFQIYEFKIFKDTNTVDKVYQINLKINNMYRMLNSQEKEFDRLHKVNFPTATTMRSQIELIDNGLNKLCQQRIELVLRADWYCELIQEYSDQTTNKLNMLIENKQFGH